jgi:hypothetical protein
VHSNENIIDVLLHYCSQQRKKVAVLQTCFPRTKNEFVTPNMISWSHGGDCLNHRMIAEWGKRSFISIILNRAHVKISYKKHILTSHYTVRCVPRSYWIGRILTVENYGGFIKGFLRGVRCTKSLRVLFLHRRPPSWTTLVLYSRAVFIFNEPAFIEKGMRPFTLKNNYEHDFSTLACR